MHRLTERRFAKAKPILDHYRKQLHATGSVSTNDLEMELRKCWDTGYRELKGIFIDLSKRPHYRYLAARYMESGCPGVVCEFQQTLADMYGIPYFDHPDREQRKGSFWRKMKRTKRTAKTSKAPT